MIRLAVIRNPMSRRNQGRPGPGLPFVHQPASPAELAATLARLRDDDTELLAVDGGDGTVREVVTGLVALRWGPRLAILPSGKINLVAGDVGARGLGDIVAAAEDGWDGFAIERRQLLRLDRTGAPPTFGMFLGAAAFTAGWRLANRHLHPRGITSGAAVAAALALTLAGSPGRLSKGVDMEVAIDGHPAPAGRRFLVLATTLDRLALGLWPFWEEGVGGLHVLDIAAPPRRLFAALPALARGRPRPWMREAGYRSGNATSMTIRSDAPVILDGEPFEPGPDRVFRLSAGPVMEFAHP
ncbi:MAG TPA: diacylglycerol kinase family protein [Candidatus Omnitrophota bacterium]|nr:diacylglycerol kinase family protein [Candidatus Omnitrophota bacterium]